MILALALAPLELRAERAWPARPIRVIVPQAPAGSVDLMVRKVGDALEDSLGEAIVIENHPGAAGAIGTEMAKRAIPDGYTLLAASTNTFAVLPHLVEHLPFDPLRDFAPVAMLGYTTKVLLVNPSFPATTVEDLILEARRRPGALNYGSTGFGSSNHLDTELFAATARIKLTHVPYRGSAQAVMALLSGELQVLIASVTAAAGAVRAGQLRALCVFSQDRVALLPDVPTATEAGIADIDLRNWIGLAAPAHTPESVITRVNVECNRILEAASMQRWFREQAIEPGSETAAQFGATIRRDYARWGSAVEKLHL